MEALHTIVKTGPQTWALSGTQMEVEVILASSSAVSIVLNIYTIRMRYPRIIHAEIMTHRVFSRNARSSRAVPVQTMLNEIRNDPFVPWHWGANQKGMQAGTECNEDVTLVEFNDDVIGELRPEIYCTREDAWIYARNEALRVAEGFMNAGYHKQIVNRLLEPFMYIDTLVTSTEWNNFLWLRDHTAAEPHLQDLSRLVREAIIGANVQTLKPGDWHLPYITEADWHAAPEDDAKGFLAKVSAARCARISYKPFDGDASYEKELERYNSLVSSDRVHASPLEHQATPDEWGENIANRHEATWEWNNPELHGNFVGWIQFRKTVSGENHTDI